MIYLLKLLYLRAEDVSRTLVLGWDVHDRTEGQLDVRNWAELNIYLLPLVRTGLESGRWKTSVS